MKRRGGCLGYGPSWYTGLVRDVFRVIPYVFLAISFCTPNELKGIIMETVKATVILVACIGMLAVLCLFAALSTYMQPERWVDRRAAN